MPWQGTNEELPNNVKKWGLWNHGWCISKQGVQPWVTTYCWRIVLHHYMPLIMQTQLYMGWIYRKIEWRSGKERFYWVSICLLSEYVMVQERRAIRHVNTWQSNLKMVWIASKTIFLNLIACWFLTTDVVMIQDETMNYLWVTCPQVGGSNLELGQQKYNRNRLPQTHLPQLQLWDTQQNAFQDCEMGPFYLVQNTQDIQK